MKGFTDLSFEPRTPSFTGLACGCPFAVHGGIRAGLSEGVSQRLGRTATQRSFHLRSARGWVLSACCMSPGIAAFVGTCLVRADCRPDMHLDRPPALPAFIALVPRLPDVPSVIREPQARHRSGHRVQLHVTKTVMTRPSPELDECSLYVPRNDVNT